MENYYKVKESGLRRSSSGSGPGMPPVSPSGPSAMRTFPPAAMVSSSLGSSSEFSVSSSQEGIGLSGGRTVDWSKRTERSRRKRENRARALHYWKLTTERKCTVAWKAYAREARYKMEFWGRISVVRGNLSLRRRCFRRWTRLPRLMNDRKHKLRTSYKYSAFRLSRKFFRAWQASVAASDGGAPPQEECQPLGRQSTLRRYFSRLASYTAYRLNRTEQYRIARRHLYRRRLSVAFRKIRKNVEVERAECSKMDAFATANSMRSVLRTWHKACLTPTEGQLRLARAACEERRKRFAVRALKAFSIASIASSRRRAQLLSAKKKRRLFGAWASAAAISRTYKRMAEKAADHDRFVTKRSFLRRWAAAASICKGETKLKSLKASRFNAAARLRGAFGAWTSFTKRSVRDAKMASIATAHANAKALSKGVLTWRAYRDRCLYRRQTNQKATAHRNRVDKLHAIASWRGFSASSKRRRQQNAKATDYCRRKILKVSVSTWSRYTRAERRERESFLHREELKKAKKLERQYLIDVGERVIVRARRPVPRVSREVFDDDDDATPAAGLLDRLQSPAPAPRGLQDGFVGASAYSFHGGRSNSAPSPSKEKDYSAIPAPRTTPSFPAPPRHSGKENRFLQSPPSAKASPKRSVATSIDGSLLGHAPPAEPAPGKPAAKRTKAAETAEYEEERARLFKVLQSEQSTVVVFEQSLASTELPELDTVIKLERSKRKVKQLEGQMSALERTHREGLGVAHEDFDDY